MNSEQIKLARHHKYIRSNVTNDRASWVRIVTQSMFTFEINISILHVRVNMEGHSWMLQIWEKPSPFSTATKSASVMCLNSTSFLTRLTDSINTLQISTQSSPAANCSGVSPDSVFVVKFAVTSTSKCKWWLLTYASTDFRPEAGNFSQATSQISKCQELTNYRHS